MEAHWEFTVSRSVTDSCLPPLTLATNSWGALHALAAQRLHQVSAGQHAVLVQREAVAEGLFSGGGRSVRELVGEGLGVHLHTAGGGAGHVDVGVAMRAHLHLGDVQRRRQRGDRLAVPLLVGLRAVRGRSQPRQSPAVGTSATRAR